MVTRFVLNNIAARVLPEKQPPYYAFHGRPSGIKETSGYSAFQTDPAGSGDRSGYDIEKMSDEQVAEFIHSNALGIPMTFPLSLKTDEGEWWELPFEPQITVSGKNRIVKKPISKGRVRGTIKERWTLDDYSVDISGILMSGTGSYPYDAVQKLRQLCEAAKLQVSCPFLEIFSISQIVVENFDFPFTSGVQNQAYSISAASDDIYRLLLKREDLKQQ